MAYSAAAQKALDRTVNALLYGVVDDAGTPLLYAGLGKIEPADITAILESRDRALAGPTLPAAGLALTGLWYDEFILP